MYIQDGFHHPLCYLPNLQKWQKLFNISVMPSFEATQITWKLHHNTLPIAKMAEIIQCYFYPHIWSMYDLYLDSSYCSSSMMFLREHLPHGTNQNPLPGNSFVREKIRMRWSASFARHRRSSESGILAPLTCWSMWREFIWKSTWLWRLSPISVSDT